MMPATNKAFSGQSSEAPAQSEDNDLAALAQQAMAEYLTPQQTEAIHELLQSGSPQGMAQIPQAAGTMSEFLRQAELAEINQRLSPQEFQLIHEQIDKWHLLEKRQNFLDKTFERVRLSPCFIKARFHGEFRAMKILKNKEREILANFEDMQISMATGMIGHYLASKSDNLSKELKKAEQRQDNFGCTLHDVKEIIQRGEIERFNDNNAMLEFSMQQAGELGTLIQEIEQKCAAESRPENLAGLKTRQTELQQQHAREMTHIGRQQNELQRLQEPWPELLSPDLCLNAGAEAQPGPSTKAGTTAQPSLPLER